MLTGVTNKNTINTSLSYYLLQDGWSSSAFLSLHHGVYLKISTSYYTLLLRTVTQPGDVTHMEVFSSSAFVFTLLIRCHSA